MAQYVLGTYFDPGTPPPEPLILVTSTIPAGFQDTLYQETQFVATGGTLPYTWDLVSPNNVLPLGMNFSPSGLLSGTPTEIGAFPLVFRITDGTAVVRTTGIIFLDVSVISTLTVTTTVLPAATRNAAYSVTVTASGGLPPYTWELVAPNNVLPTGLTRTGATISGTPSVFETKSLVFRVTDADTLQANSGVMDLVVNQVPELAITTPSSLPQGEINNVYPEYTFNTSGGYGTKTWSILTGSFPTGLSFNTSTGKLTGTPTGSAATASVTLKVVDSEAREAIKAFTLQVVAEGTVEGPHDYFNTWVADANHYASWSLRNQTQLDNSIGAGFRPSSWVTYDYAGDTAPNKQDAAKLTLPANTGKIPIGNRPSFRWQPAITTGSIIACYDVYVDSSWRIGMDGAPDMRGNKSWRIHRQINGSWAHMWNYTGDHLVPTPQVTIHDEASIGPVADGVIFQEHFEPAGVGTWPQGKGDTQLEYYQLIPNVWHRVWFEVRYLVDPSEFTEWNAAYGVTVRYNENEALGRWHMKSKWIMREGEGSPTRLLYKVPVQVARLPTQDPWYYVDMQIQFDSSQNGTGALNKWSYHRNLFILKDYTLPAEPETDTALFKAPVRTL